MARRCRSRTSRRQDPQAPEFGGEPGRLRRGVGVGHADQDQQSGLVDRPDRHAVHHHRRGTHPLYDCTHEPHHLVLGDIPGTWDARAPISVVDPLVAEVVRSGFVESRHRARIWPRLRRDVRVHRGQREPPVFPRSANKPLQAVAMLRAGLPLEGELLALAAASHSGEDFHVAGRARDPRLGRADRGRPALPAGAARSTSRPRDAAASGRATAPESGSDTTARASTRRCSPPASPTTGRRRPTWTRRIRCRGTSGDHRGTGHGAGRRHRGRRVRRPAVRADAGGPGPGVPRARARAEPGTPERKVADAMRKFPEWTSGTTRDERPADGARSPACCSRPAPRASTRSRCRTAAPPR